MNSTENQFANGNSNVEQAISESTACQTLVNGLDKSIEEQILIDLNAHLDTGQTTMQLTDGQLKSNASARTASPHTSTGSLAVNNHMVSNAVNTQDDFVKQQQQETIVDSRQANAQSNSDADLVDTTKGHQMIANCTTNTVNSSLNSSNSSELNSKLPNEQPSNTENVPQQTKSPTDLVADTPKRLHVSNIPFKYTDAHLRRLFAVSLLLR